MHSESSALTQQEAELLVAQLAHLRPQSAFALKAAVMAMQAPGVEGVLTIRISRNPKDFPELRFTTGQHEAPA